MKAVKNAINTKLEFVYQKRSCSIMFKSKKVYTLIEELDNLNDIRSYVFIPCWDTIYSFTKEDGYYGMIGINEDLHLEEYIRTGILPSFISYRVPSDGRQGLEGLYRRVGLSWFDKFEYMILTGGKCSCDIFYVELQDDDLY